MIDFYDVRKARLAFAEAHGMRFRNSRLVVELDRELPNAVTGQQYATSLALLCTI